MTNQELDAQFCNEVEVALDPMGAWRLITSLRTQLAEANARADRAEADLQALTLLKENYAAMKDRAEAERAAQIEVDAEIAEDMNDHIWSYSTGNRGRVGCDPVAEAIRAQPHDRTALDRMLAGAREISEAEKIAIRNKALREAAEICSSIRQRIANGPMPEGARFDYEQSILALIDSEQPKENMQK